MPALKNRLPKYRLHKPSGQALVQINGVRTYLGKYGSDESRRRYDQIIAQFLAERSTGQEVRFSPRPSRAQPITVAEVCLAYWQFAERYYSRDGEQTGYVGVVKRALHWMNALYADESAAEFGPVKLQRYQQHLIPRKLSRVYINSLVRIVKRMFKWAASQEMLPGSLYQDLTTVPGLRKGRTEARETKPVGAVADGVVEATLEYLPPIVDDMIRLQRLTGMRPTEVCLLRPGDVERSDSVWEYIPERHKTEHHGHRRVILIGPKAQRILAPYLLRPADRFCFSPKESEARRHEEMRARRKTPVQPSQRNRSKRNPQTKPGDKYTRRSYRQAVIRAVRQANRDRKARQVQGDAVDLLPEWTPNQLRHSAATEIRRQFGLEAAQVILGHSKADVTQVYAERDTRLAREVVSKIG